MTNRKSKFDAVAESRRWRRATSRLLATMTVAEQIAHLNRRLDRFETKPMAKDLAKAA